ncbi:MAG: hypothetical protein AAF962_21090 [Actinomycetota bacterium]
MGDFEGGDPADDAVVFLGLFVDLEVAHLGERLAQRFQQLVQAVRLVVGQGEGGE